jgi:hypothetical protein
VLSLMDLSTLTWQQQDFGEWPQALPIPSR